MLAEAIGYSWPDKDGNICKKAMSDEWLLSWSRICTAFGTGAGDLDINKGDFAIGIVVLRFFVFLGISRCRLVLSRLGIFLRRGHNNCMCIYKVRAICDAGVFFSGVILGVGLFWAICVYRQY